MMKRTANGIMLLLMATALLAVGCGEDSTTGLTDEQTADLSTIEYLDDVDATVVEAWVAEDEADAPVEQDLGVVDVLHAVHLPNIDFLLSGMMKDTTITTEWFTHTIDWTFYDADDNASETFSDATVSADVEHSSEGTRTSPRGHHTKSFTRSASLSYVGFAAESESLTVNGTGTATQNDTVDSRRDTTLTAVGEGSVSWEIAALVISKDLETLPWPLSGTISVEGNRSRTITSATMDTTVTQSFSYVVTFDGSQYATVVFDDATEVVIDLAYLPDPGRFGGCPGEPEDYGQRRDRIRGPRR